MLSQSQFEVLYYIKKNVGDFVQRDISESLSISLGKINNILAILQEERLIERKSGFYKITENGLSALEPYKVDNAIIMAAGMSSRFAPLSYEKPKGLLTVKGEILIEREIKQLQEAGITDITIVVGYLKEKFFYLADKYNVRIVVNEDYYRFNNTSTLMRVLDKLSNTYICSSDNYFVDNVFEEYVYNSYYSTVYTAGETEEWCVQTDKTNRIKSVSIGGRSSWYMLGHVYWNSVFSKKFKDILCAEYENPETKEGLWEKLYIKYIKELDLYAKHYDFDKVLEFDSLEELRCFDSEYVNNADSDILRNICAILKCEIKDIVNIKAIKAGLTNTSFKFSVNNKNYVYRHPGRGTENYINRESEAFSMSVASKLELDNTFIYIDNKKGWKISTFIDNARELDYHNMNDVTKAISMMKKLHTANIVSKYDFDIWKKTEEFIEKLKILGKTDFEGFDALYKSLNSVHKKIIDDRYTKRCLCHCDCYSPNFLLDKDDNMFLIDWEYSGNDDPASDLGTFICCSDYSYEESLNIIKLYLGYEPDAEELAHYLGYIAEAAYYWYVWALYQDTRGNSVGEWEYLWYQNSKFYADLTLK